MKSYKSKPPDLALWCLHHLVQGQHREALTGDLIEKFQEGATRKWFWKQVLIACFTDFIGEVRRRWALFWYAIAGTIAICFLPPSLPDPVSFWFHWSNFPWPLSQFIFEMSTPTLVSLAALGILAGGLAIQRSLRWSFLLRTWIANLSLITLVHFTIGSIPLLLRPVPGDPYHRILIIPAAIQVLITAITFLVAAWIDYPAERTAANRQSPPA